VVAVLLLVAVLTSPLWLRGASAGAAADPPGSCQNTNVCVGASNPPGGGGSSGGSGGSGGGGGGVPVCTYQGAYVPCSNQYGAFDSADGCYYAALQPQPPAGDPDWMGHQPGDGAVYTRTCPFQPGSGQANVWLAQAPAAPPVITPAELAQRAIAMIVRSAATVRTAPSAGGTRTALVGSPIWLWIQKTGTDYAPRTHPLAATASVPGLSVTAEVYVTGVDWDMGDGRSPLACGAGGGTPYRSSDGSAASPDCGYSFSRPSIGRPAESYAITATVKWAGYWYVNGDPANTTAFAVDPIGTPATVLKVSELQVLN
jgi:hypothetical protein